jgi:hypothetical protein
LKLKIKCTMLKNISNYNTHNNNNDWLKMFKKTRGHDKLNLTPNLLLNWVSRPIEAQCIFFLVFWNLIPYVTKEGVLVSFLPNFMNNFTIQKSCKKHVEEALGIQYGICQRFHGLLTWYSNHFKSSSHSSSTSTWFWDYVEF